jgi:acyl-CoA reductase-like NAD-dependent aldehyde dehydrogenase
MRSCCLILRHQWRVLLLLRSLVRGIAAKDVGRYRRIIVILVARLSDPSADLKEPLFKDPTSGTAADVPANAAVAREETFGPLAPLFRFETDNEALQLANDTEFGLASYFYSRDISQVWRVAEGSESGMVGINTGMLSTEVAPFGGSNNLALAEKVPNTEPKSF